MVEETMQCQKIQLWSSGRPFTDKGTSVHGQYRKAPSTPQKRDSLIISSTRLECWTALLSYMKL